MLTCALATTSCNREKTKPTPTLSDSEIYALADSIWPRPGNNMVSDSAKPASTWFVRQLFVSQGNAINELREDVAQLQSASRSSPMQHEEIDRLRSHVSQLEYEVSRLQSKVRELELAR